MSEKKSSGKMLFGSLIILVLVAGLSFGAYKLIDHFNGKSSSISSKLSTCELTYYIDGAKVGSNKAYTDEVQTEETAAQKDAKKTSNHFASLIQPGENNLANNFDGTEYIGWYSDEACSSAKLMSSAKFFSESTKLYGKKFTIDKTGKYFTTQDSNGGVIITGYTTNEFPCVFIPEKINGKNVVGISVSPSPFYNHQEITAVFIPKTFTKIEQDYFEACNTLGDVYYYNNIDGWLTLIKNTNENLLNQYTRANESQKRYLHLANDKGYYNVQDHNATKIDYTVPTSITSLPAYAFSEWKIFKSITLPAGLTQIGSKAFFKNYYLESATFSNNLSKWCQIDFADVDATPMRYAKKLYLSDGKDLYAYSTFNIPEDITQIKKSTFLHFANLKSITIPSNITKIDDYAFFGHSDTFTMDIPYSVKYLGKLISNVRDIDETRKSNVINVEFKYHGTLYDWLKINFSGDSPSRELNINKNYGIEIGKGLLYLKKDTATTDTDDDYYCLNKQTEITIPSGITTIPGGAFSCFVGTQAYNASSGSATGTKVKINIPEGVTKIGRYAFDYFLMLDDIVIPNSVTEIGEGAFENCLNIGSITFKDVDQSQLKTIGMAAFNECREITSFTIPSGVTSIGKHAFLFCNSLTSVRFSDTTHNWQVKGSQSNAAVETISVATPATNALYLKTDETKSYCHHKWVREDFSYGQE